LRLFAALDHTKQVSIGRLFLALRGPHDAVGPLDEAITTCVHCVDVMICVHYVEIFNVLVLLHGFLPQVRSSWQVDRNVLDGTQDIDRRWSLGRALFLLGLAACSSCPLLAHLANPLLLELFLMIFEALLASQAVLSSLQEALLVSHTACARLTQQTRRSTQAQSQVATVLHIHQRLSMIPSILDLLVYLFV